MKKLLPLLLLFMHDANAQLRHYQDDNFAGYGSGGAIIVSIIVVLVLIFGGSGGRWGVFCLVSLFALPTGLALLGNNILPTPNIVGDLSLAGFIGIFLGLYLWPKLLNFFENKDSKDE
jgi:hypothetical protein